MRELLSPCPNCQKDNQFSNIFLQSFNSNLFHFFTSHCSCFKLAGFVFLYTLTESAKILDEVQILCSHTSTSTVNLYLYFLRVYSPASNLFLAYTHTQIHFPFCPKQTVAKGEVFLQVCSPPFTLFENFQ